MNKISPHLIRSTVAALVVIAALLLMMCPIPVIMLSMSQMVLVSMAALAFMVWVAFYWQERPVDERDELHQFLAARVSYLIGAAILMLGILVETLNHHVNAWLVGALIGMILAKIIAKIFAEKYY